MDALQILLVEDNYLTATDIRSKLQQMGHEVVAICTSRDQTLQDFKQYLPQLVLMDIDIKGEHDGIETADQLWQDWEVPVIFLTNLEDDRYRRRAGREQLAAFLAKPFSPHQFSNTIKQLLPEGGQPPRSKQRLFEDSLFIKDTNKKQEIRIAIADIRFIKADGNGCRIYYPTAAGGWQRTPDTLSMGDVYQRIQQKAPSLPFRQVHRSFVVNFRHITGREGNQLLLGQEKVPVGERYQKEVFELLG